MGRGWEGDDSLCDCVVFGPHMIMPLIQSDLCPTMYMPQTCTLSPPVPKGIRICRIVQDGNPISLEHLEDACPARFSHLSEPVPPLDIAAYSGNRPAYFECA